jgi:hypothetical protein
MENDRGPVGVEEFACLGPEARRITVDATRREVAYVENMFCADMISLGC